MPRACLTCSHSERERIDAALSAGASLTGLAARYDLSIQSLSRHRQRHSAGVNILQRALIAPDLSQGDLLEVAAQALHSARAIAVAAERQGRSSVMLQSLASVRECVRLIRELTGSTDDPEEIVTELRAGERLAAALAAAIRDAPEIAATVAKHLDASKEIEMADAIRALGRRTLERK